MPSAEGRMQMCVLPGEGGGALYASAGSSCSSSQSTLLPSQHVSHVVDPHPHSHAVQVGWGHCVAYFDSLLTCVAVVVVGGVCPRTLDGGTGRQRLAMCTWCWLPIVHSSHKHAHPNRCGPCAPPPHTHPLPDPVSPPPVPQPRLGRCKMLTCSNLCIRSLHVFNQSNTPTDAKNRG